MFFFLPHLALRVTYISHIRRIQFCACGCATAAAVRLLQVETAGIQRVNM